MVEKTPKVGIYIKSMLIIMSFPVIIKIRKKSIYEPKHGMEDRIKSFGHGGSDFYSMWHFVEKIKGNPDADIIDVYEALDMALPGMFAFHSILDGGKSKDIPDLRYKSVRDTFRNDTACTDAKVAGDKLLPTTSKGTPDIDDAVYENMKRLWDEECRKKDSGYRLAAFKQGSDPKK